MAYNYTWGALNNPGNYPAFAESHKPDFEPGIDAFSLATAWWMCGFSHLAYHEPNNIDNTLRTLGMQLVVPFDIRDMQGFVAKGTLNGQRVGLLSFRGTNPHKWADWRVNLNALPTPFPGGGYVHRGFMKATEWIWPVVRPHVEAMSDEGLPLYYAGHSLGGAMAGLADTLFPANAIYTFGMPRIGDTEFCRLRAERPLYRTVDCADIVPHAPPAWLFSYRHLPDFRFLDHEGNYSDNPSPTAVHARIEVAELAYRQLPSPRRIFTRHLADHAILNYSEGLIRAIGHSPAT